MQIALWKLFLAVIIVLLIVPIFYTHNLIVYLQLFGLLFLLIPLIVIVAGMLIQISKPFQNMTEASENSLRREDDVFLQGVGFSQSTLFIILNLEGITVTPLAQLWKWAIPPIAIVFFLLRGYAKISESQRRAAKCRLYSMAAVFGILFFNIYLFGLFYLPVIGVSGYNVAPLYWATTNFFLWIFAVGVVYPGLQKRYNIFD